MTQKHVITKMIEACSKQQQRQNCEPDGRGPRHERGVEQNKQNPKELLRKIRKSILKKDLNPNLKTREISLSSWLVP